MMLKSIIPLFLFTLFSCGDVHSFVLTIEGDTTESPRGKPLRVYNTFRLTTEKPRIDGILNDACWKTGEWAGDFTQWIPKEGAKPSQRTELKILYDDKNIYVAIRAFDSEPEKISRRAGRRDEFVGDIVGINFDSYHDHRTGFEFDVTAAGQKLDLLLTNPSNGDLNWNAVWYGKAGMEDSAWTVEMEIPLSQLRYSSDDVQVWGMHCWRWIDRLQEESDWEPQSSTGPGILYLFGELRGISGLPASRRIEIMPYSLGKLNTFQKQPGNPFADKGRTWAGNIGLDAKVGVTSNFTADIAVNPDFGQVESDPSVMNLTAFETFYEEKRPFFLEGANIFGFDFDDVNLFYSRRIGHPPSYMPELSANEYMSFPENTSIISAVKLSGKTADGLSVGLLQSVTAKEQADISSLGTDRKVVVEPLTSFSIVRVQQDFEQGNTVLGGIITSTNRAIMDSQLDFLNRDAYTGGIDLLHQWNDKEFYVQAKIVGSNIEGAPAAITALQMSPARYYQRPDAGYLNFDSTRTSLSGYGGELKIGKGSKGLWRYSTEFDWRSPGLDFNDLGYMQIADIIKLDNSISYFVNEPVSIFRTYSIGLEQMNDWDYGMQHLSSGAELNIYLEFLNKWGLSSSFEYVSEALDTRLLRGGAAVLVPPVGAAYFYARTDPSATVYLDCSADFSAAGNARSRYASIQPGLSVTPLNTIRLSVSVNYSSNVDDLQYVDAISIGGANKYILGRIAQHTIGATFRVDYNISPELSIQYYGSPFASVGRYSGFRSVANPEAGNYGDRFSAVDATLNGDAYDVYEAAGAGASYRFTNPDFNFYQFRSNLVLRWEYLPGSQLYLVWSQDRTSFVQPGGVSAVGAIGSLGDVFPDNIFLAKLSYWFTI